MGICIPFASMRCEPLEKEIQRSRTSEVGWCRTFSVNPAEFAMIPGDNLYGLHDHDNTFGGLRLNHLARVFVERASIALKNQFAILLNGLALVDNLRLPFDLHTAQLFIAL